jgi:hypothetical protein
VLSTQASTVDLRLRRFSAKNDACGRSFAVLWTQVSTVGIFIGRQGWYLETSAGTSDHE